MENRNSLTDLENQLVFTIHISIAFVPTSSVVLIFESQIGENIYAPPSSDASTNSDTVSDDDLPVALRKSKYTCTSHSLYRFVSYSHLSPSFYVFISSMNSYYVLKSVSEALSISGWKNALNRMTPEILLFFLSERKQLDDSGYTL